VIRRDHRLEPPESHWRNDAELSKVAFELADAVHALVVGCTAAVVLVEPGSEWRLLAQRGALDVSSSWRRLVARHARSGDEAWDPNEPLVVPFPSPAIRVMLVAVPVDGISLPAGVREIVQPILDAGGILFAAAGSAGAGERGGLRLVGASDRPAER
jgi:hypothetical protein